MKIAHKNVIQTSTVIDESKFRAKTKEAKLTMQAGLIIAEFSEKIDEEMFRNLSKDDSILLSKFNVIEENIIKLMDEKHIRELEEINVQEIRDKEIAVSYLLLYII